MIRYLNTYLAIGKGLKPPAFCLCSYVFKIRTLQPLKVTVKNK